MRVFDQAMRERRYSVLSVLRSKQRGQAVVEFLLVFGVLILLIFGLVNIGQLLLSNYTINQAARVAAHQAAIEGGDVSAAQDAAYNTIKGGVTTSQENIESFTVVCADAEDLSMVKDPCRRYDAITVSIVYESEFLIPMPPLFSTFTVTADATRAAERDQQ